MAQQVPATAIVADDDDITRKVLTAQLRSAGVATVLEARNGAQALALAAQHPSALVLGDLSMPDVDGVELVRGLGSAAPGAALMLISAADPKVLAMVRAIATRAGVRVVGSSRKPVAAADLEAALAAAARPAPAAPPGPALSADEVRRALSQGEIESVYLPTVRVRDGALLGCEALARWRHPAHGVVLPERFIPLIEQAGLMWELTASMAERAVAQLAEWRRAGLPLSVAVNIPASGSGGLGFPDLLERIARGHGIDPTLITLELTEQQLAISSEIYDIIARLSLKGFALAIDDYGIGNSGLEQLRRLPFAKLKLDRSLVHGVADDAEQRAILESSIRLGQRLDLDVVAEGVERPQDWRVLQALGCDAAQGYLMTPPLPAAELAAWAKRWRESPPAAIAAPRGPASEGHRPG